MQIGMAIAIFRNIKVADVSETVKAESIKRVLEMPTHNSITKDEILNVVEWLLNQAFEFEE